LQTVAHRDDDVVERIIIVKCPTCWREVEIRSNHRERDMQAHILEHGWNPDSIISEAIWGR
jgi:hypothetical protein